MKKVFLILLLLLISCPVWGATYYIRQDGTAAIGSTSSCDTANTAANISAHNGASFSAEDLIILCHQGGPFGDSDNLVAPSSGSSGSPIIYRGESNAGSNWHWQGTVTASDKAIDFTNKSYLTFEDLKIRYMGYGINGNEDSDNIIIQNNEFEFNVHNAIKSYVSTNNCKGLTPSDADCADDWIVQDNIARCSGVADGDGQFEVESAKDWTITRNHIYCEDTDAYVCAGSSSGSPFESGVDGITIIDSNGIVVEYNKIHDHRKSQGCYTSGYELSSTDDGENEIDIKGSRNITIRYNDIYGGSVGVNESLIHFHLCGAPDNADDLTMYGNWLHDTDSNTGGLYFWPHTTGTCDGAYVYGNLLSNIGGRGLGFSNSGGSGLKNVRVYNNSFYEVGNSGATSSGPIYGTTATGTNEIKNNLFEGCNGGSSVCIRMPSDWVSSNNKAYNSSGTENVYIGSVTGFEDHDGASSNDEGASSDFTSAATDDFTTKSLVSGANLGSGYDDLLDEDVIWPNVLNGSSAIISADPDLFNSGVWPRGAYVYGSESTGDQPRDVQGLILR